MFAELLGFLQELIIKSSQLIERQLIKYLHFENDERENTALKGITYRKK